MAYTDFVTLFLSIFLFLLGASRGFMRSLMGPISVIIATFISIFFYQLTQALVVSLVIAIVGPFLITLLLKFLLRAWVDATDRDIKPGFVSCLVGSLLTLAWGWVFIIFTLILCTVLPSWGQNLTSIHDDVVKSGSYTVIAKPWEECFFGAPQLTTSTQTTPDADADAKTLAADPRFQAILQDPEIKKDIDAHDLASLMKNPKMMEFIKQVVSDPAAMQRVLNLSKKQIQPQTSN